MKQSCDCEHLRREIDDLRYEQQQREEREQYLRDKERREREERRRAALPSNRLYNGEVSDFCEAMDCVIAACGREIVEPESDADRKCNQSLIELSEIAAACRDEYRAAMKMAEEALIAKWRESGDADKSNIADCLEGGDYSPLAI